MDDGSHEEGDDEYEGKPVLLLNSSTRSQDCKPEYSQ